MEKNAIEKLNDCIIEKNSRIVAGLDPTWEIVPKGYYNYNAEESQNGEYDDINRKSFFRKFCFDYINAVKNYLSDLRYFDAKNIAELKFYSAIASYGVEDQIGIALLRKQK